MLGMRALGIGQGDEVITPPNSFVASTASIVAVGATPVFADVRDDQNIDPEAVSRSDHAAHQGDHAGALTGRVCRHGPADGDRQPAQPRRDRGCRAVDRLAATTAPTAAPSARSAAFSAHPLKNLNAAGDGGFLMTNDDAIAEKVKLLRNHGLADRNTVTTWGAVSRMDVLQAEILRLRLKSLPNVVERRRANAARYRRLLNGVPVFAPPCGNREFNTFHLFVIQTDRRNELQAYLQKEGIGTAIHYPVPIHLQPAAKDLNHRKGDFPMTERQSERILSLPIHQFLSEDDQVYVVDKIKAFVNG